MSYSATILADSLANGVRLTTVMATFPRFILAEVNTHRVFSRNSASSRAIPTESLIERVRADPFVPETFNKRVKGMGIGDELGSGPAQQARAVWKTAADDAAYHAQALAEIGIDKSRANRLLEPFMWHTAIITSTEWSNFFGLRCPADGPADPNFPAQIEFQKVAVLMRDAMRNSEPAVLVEGQWHTPLVDFRESMEIDLRQFGASNREVATDRVLRQCARRLARVSFDKHMDTEPYAVSIGKAGELVGSGHFSPTEHIATPLSQQHVLDPDKRRKLMVPVEYVWQAINGSSDDASDNAVPIGEIWSGNLRGWWQYRKGFVNEDDFSRNLA